MSLSLEPRFRLPTIRASTPSSLAAGLAVGLQQTRRVQVAAASITFFPASTRTSSLALRTRSFATTRPRRMPQHFAATQALPGGPEPAFIGTKELLIERALARLRSIPSPLEQYTFLASLRNRNADVFYGLVGGNMKECCVSPPRRVVQDPRPAPTAEPMCPEVLRNPPRGKRTSLGSEGPSVGVEAKFSWTRGASERQGSRSERGRLQSCRGTRLADASLLPFPSVHAQKEH